MMSAIVTVPSIVLALIKPILRAIAAKVIHHNLARASPKPLDCGFCASEAQLAASDMGIRHLECVVANGAPLATTEDLHPAAVGSATCKAEFVFAGPLWRAEDLHVSCGSVPS